MVSIVIPCYNYAHFLPAAVASVVAQTYTDWELLIVDDGSSDDTLVVAKRLITHYGGRRIQLWQQPNCGLARARNSGAAHARGSYLLFLDADDMIAPETLACMTQVLDNDPTVGFVYGGMRLFGDDEHLRLGIPFDLRLLALDNIAAVLGLVRRCIWHELGGYDEGGVLPRGFEDWDFWLRVAAGGWRGVGLREPLFYYRRHGSSMSSGGLPHEWDTRAILVLRHPQLYGPRLVAWASRRCGQRTLPSRPRRYNERPPTAQLVAQSPGNDWAQPPSPPPPLPVSTKQAVTLAQRVVRQVPFALRLRARWWWRRSQLALRATGFWV